MPMPKGNAASVQTWCEENDVFCTEQVAKVGKGDEQQSVDYATPNFVKDFSGNDVEVAVGINSAVGYFASVCDDKDPGNTVLANLTRQQSTDHRNGIASSLRVDPVKAVLKENIKKMAALQEADPEKYQQLLSLLGQE